MDWQPEQPGDVPQTYADITKARALLHYQPHTDFHEGLKTLLDWLTTEVPAVTHYRGGN